MLKHLPVPNDVSYAGVFNFLLTTPFCVPSDFAYGMMPFLAEQTSTRLSVSLASGLVAGVCAAIVSQPGEVPSGSGI